MAIIPNREISNRGEERSGCSSPWKSTSTISSFGSRILVENVENSQLFEKTDFMIEKGYSDDGTLLEIISHMGVHSWGKQRYQIK